jgi:hypothetical protein
MSNTEPTKHRTARPYAGRLVTWLGYVAMVVLMVVAIKLVESLPRSGMISETTRDLITGGLLGGLPIVIWGWPRFVVAIGRRLSAKTAQEVLQSDSRPPILYLRSFSADEKAATWVGRLRPSFEENLTLVLSELGPVIAIGQPGERLPSLGAARMYVTGDDWQSAVSALMSNAAVVVVKAGVTQGLSWEISQIARKVNPHRALIALPSQVGRSRGSVEEQYRRFREQIGPSFPSLLPERVGSARWVAFDDDWSPRLLNVPRWWKRWILGQGENSVAALREELRPFCKALGYPLSRSRTLLSAIFVPLALVLFAAMLVFTAQVAIDPVTQDLKNLLQPRELKSERGMFEVVLPAGWSQVPKEIKDQVPQVSEDRLFAMHMQLGRGGFGVFALIERFSKTQITMSLEEFSMEILTWFTNVAERPTGPFPGTVGQRPARIYRLRANEFQYIAIFAETSTNFYYIKGWSQPEFFSKHIDEIETLASSLTELWE